LPEEPGNLTVLKFDPTKSFAERLTIFETINIQSNNISPDNATSAKWSPDGKFIATTSRYNGDVKGFSKVFAFDPTKPKDERLTEIGSYDTSTALPNSTDWDTIGKYVATGGFGGVFPEINVLLLCQGTVGPCP